MNQFGGGQLKPEIELPEEINISNEEKLDTYNKGNEGNIYERDESDHHDGSDYDDLRFENHLEDFCFFLQYDAIFFILVYKILCYD